MSHEHFLRSRFGTTTKITRTLKTVKLVIFFLKKYLIELGFDKLQAGIFALNDVLLMSRGLSLPSAAALPAAERAGAYLLLLREAVQRSAAAIPGFAKIPLHSSYESCITCKETVEYMGRF